MGDIIEFVQWPVQHRKICYRVKSSALRFEVKPGRHDSSVSIGLSAKPDCATCAFWICIGYQTRNTLIRDSQNNHRSEISTPDIISADEYRAFWLQWCNGEIRFGRDGEEEHVVRLRVDTSIIAKLQYVLFHEPNQSEPIYWRIELPPKLPPPCTRPISGGRLFWQTGEEQLPDGALIGGYEKESLYIIRMVHRRSLAPGKFVPSEGIAYIAWGGNAVPGADFEVLCGFNGIWVPTTSDRLPEGAFEGGYSEVAAERLFVGRAYHNGHLIPGKVQPSHKVIYIPYEGKEIAKEKFEVLVDANHDSRSEHSFVPLSVVCSVDSEAEESMAESPPSSPDYNYQEEAVYVF